MRTVRPGGVARPSSGVRRRTPWAVPDAFSSVIANLAIDNMGFADYLDSADLDASGVYRLSDRHRQAMADLRAHTRP